MKKILLVLTLGMFALVSSAQEVFFVYPPAVSAGSYDMTWADDWGANPDFTDPANNLEGELALAYDGQELDDNSENDAWDVCEDIINPEEIDGKIAVIYRGLCEFGAKALRCQNAGAIAVVIINRDNEVVGMGGGADGFNVTIPVVMITSFGGADIVDEMANSTVTVMMGTNNGSFANNVGLLSGDFLRTRFGAHRLGSASLSDDFQVGTWVRNFGFDPADVVVDVQFLQDGVTDPLYDETSESFTIPAGDSLFYMLPDFDIDLVENGIYRLNYNIALALDDEFIYDNNATSLLYVNDDKLAYCRFGEEGFPQIASGTRPADHSDGDNYTQCTMYREANGSDVQAEGLWFAASIDTPEELTGQLMTATLFQWNDEFEDMNDPDFLFDDMEDLSIAQYEYTENAANEYIYIPFETPVAFEDDVKYLFCVTSTAGGIRMGYDDGMDYSLNIDQYLQPSTVMEINGDWSIGFTGGGVQTVVAVVGDNSVGIDENVVSEIELEAYPNPAVTEIRIPLNNSKKIVEINVFDTSGKLVMTHTSIQEFSKILNVDVSELEGGLYSFNALFEDGTSSSFNVVVTK